MSNDENEPSCDISLTPYYMLEMLYVMSKQSAGALVTSLELERVLLIDHLELETVTQSLEHMGLLEAVPMEDKRCYRITEIGSKAYELLTEAQEGYTTTKQFPILSFIGDSKSVLILNRLARGDKFGVFIDDTGSSGVKDRPADGIPDDAYVAVVVHPEDMAEVLTKLHYALQMLEEETGAMEFHFKDIYNHKNEHRASSLMLRLGWFNVMAELFSQYKFPIIVQQVPRESKSREGILDSLSKLMELVCEYIGRNKKSPETTAIVCVDSGFFAEEQEIALPALPKVVDGGTITFLNSGDMYPLQLADFAAFGTNRVQLATLRRKFKAPDAMLIEMIMSKISLNYTNLERRTVRLKQLGGGYFELEYDNWFKS